MLGFFIEKIDELPFGLNFVDKREVVLSDERNHHHNWREIFYKEIARLYRDITESGQNVNNPVFARLNSVVYEFFDQPQHFYPPLSLNDPIYKPLAKELLSQFFQLYGHKSVIVRYENYIISFQFHLFF